MLILDDDNFLVSRRFQPAQRSMIDVDLEYEVKIDKWLDPESKKR